MIEIMKEYTYLGKSDGRRFCIDGVDVFSRKWRSLGECDIVLHPETKKPYSFSVYSIETAGKNIVFLAGKFDGDDWGFFKEFDDEDIIF